MSFARQYTHFYQENQAFFCLFHGINDNWLPDTPAADATYFRMIFISDNHHTMSLLSFLLYNTVNFFTNGHVASTISNPSCSSFYRHPARCHVIGSRFLLHRPLCRHGQAWHQYLLPKAHVHPFVPDQKQPPHYE